MAKVQKIVLENKLEELQKEGIPGDLIQKIRSKIENEELEEMQLDYFLNKICIDYHNALMESSNPVGTIAAQSIGEPSTQMTLRTFHHAGMEEFAVSAGLPRLIELVDARRTPAIPQMTLYLEPECCNSEDKAIEILHQIEQVMVEQMAYNVDMDYANWQIIVNLSSELCEKKGISEQKLVEIFKRSIKGSKVKHENNVIIFNSQVEDIKVLLKLREKIIKKVVQGIKGITKVGIGRDELTNEWIIKTEGSNLTAISQVNGIDSTRIYSNDLHEVEKIYGIEAARNILIKELVDITEQQDISIDSRHLLILADSMCFSGSIRSIGRHGISGMKSSVFARAAFEKANTHLFNAGIHGKVEGINGITENIIVGQICRMGTGKIKLEYDIDAGLKTLKNLFENV